MDNINIELPETFLYFFAVLRHYFTVTLFCRDSNNYGGSSMDDSVELFADQLLEITTQVLRADDNGMSHSARLVFIFVFLSVTC